MANQPFNVVDILLQMLEAPPTVGRMEIVDNNHPTDEE